MTTLAMDAVEVGSPHQSETVGPALDPIILGAVLGSRGEGPVSDASGVKDFPASWETPRRPRQKSLPARDARGNAVDFADVAFFEL